MTVYSTEKIGQVLAEFRRTRGSPFKTARNLETDIEVVFEILDANKDQTGRPKQKFDGFGRPGLHAFIVGRRLDSERQWDNDDVGIAKARADYEAGTVELCQGRDGPWIIQYAIPRTKISPRPNYFQPDVA